MYSFTEENYLKAIYKLQEKQEDAISTNSIADSLNTRAASVTDMVQKLSSKSLLIYEKYRGVVLTETGKKVAVNLVRKHRLWETFLVEKLRFTWDEVHELAEQLEHIQSEELINKLDEFLGFPKQDPHGDPIPQRDGKMISQSLILLEHIPVANSAVISGVVNHSPVFLQYLQKQNLVLGKTVLVLERNAFDNSMAIRLGGEKDIQVSAEVARNLLMLAEHNSIPQEQSI